MQELITNLVEKAGLNQEQAQKAVEATVNFVKEKVPAGLSDKVEDLLSGKFDLSSLGSLFEGGNPLDKLKDLL